MYVIVAGGGKVGFYLARALLNEGHEVLVVEKNKRKSASISEELGSIVMLGNADEARTLEEAGANRAHVVVAVTGDDEDNLVICQVAKHKFKVDRTIARINNPKNEAIFKLLGIDATVSSTNLILAQIEQELPSQALIHHLLLQNVGLELVEGVVSSNSPVVGKPLKDVKLPGNTKIILMMRGQDAIVPTGSTEIEALDSVMAVTKIELESELRQLLLD
jgi:trk system potassium uptake protein TrkA